MPPHCCTYYGDEELLEKYFGSTNGAGIFHNSCQYTEKCCTEAQCRINTDVEKWVFSGAGQIENWSTGRTAGLQAVDGMREVMRAK